MITVSPGMLIEMLKLGKPEEEDDGATVEG